MPRNTNNAGAPQSHYAGQMQPSLGSSSIYDQPRVTVPANYYTIPSSSSSVMPLPQQQEPDYASYAPDPVPAPPTQHRASSGAWSPQNDQQLLTARMQGLNWGQIKDAYFPTKTANACRKRHERLMERKGADDWDNRKLQQLAKEYMSMRKEIWSGLAARTGEKWNVVEQKCMSNGLKNLQSAARAASRRNRLETSSHVTGYDDDSGISGIGLTPVDELDASYSSPESHVGHLQPPQGSYAVGAYASGYGATNGGHHGYSSSVSSATSAAGRRQYVASTHPGGRGHGHGSSQYLDAQRMSAADMGIGAIINRPGGGKKAA
ncbi:MYB-like protein [Hirsutella rhossiliensis]|uniref:MYB-like protein n=1 Tax=Hirsutella rhossiliensis TaxID=111463 RepID=A0A9P8SJ13_9HYPO|nr:MYB-like protein [Hirsutella rhossiliensis]KAH0964803.1 MYB-like protein [Hirsutella rhossiliensis]